MHDKALPFGLCSAPKLFTAAADDLAWALCCRGVSTFVHYLDNFFYCAPSSHPACGLALETAIPLCMKLRLSVAPAKLEGPSTAVTFLGIEINSVVQELPMPHKKLTRIQRTIKQWEGHFSAPKHDLQSFTGLLNHATAVVKPGCTFLHQLIDAMKCPKDNSPRFA